ncbi:hypothetical protein ACFL0Q_05865, partial [Thermodesulfobacteriota bacterium]
MYLLIKLGGTYFQLLDVTPDSFPRIDPNPMVRGLFRFHGSKRNITQPQSLDLFEIIPELNPQLCWGEWQMLC